MINQESNRTSRSHTGVASQPSEHSALDCCVLSARNGSCAVSPGFGLRYQPPSPQRRLGLPRLTSPPSCPGCVYAAILPLRTGRFASFRRVRAMRRPRGGKLARRLRGSAGRSFRTHAPRRFGRARQPWSAASAGPPARASSARASYGPRALLRPAPAGPGAQALPAGPGDGKFTTAAKSDSGGSLIVILSKAEADNHATRAFVSSGNEIRHATGAVLTGDSHRARLRVWRTPTCFTYW